MPYNFPCNRRKQTILMYLSFATVAVHLLIVVLCTIAVLLSVAYATLAERKVMGSMQRRLGPNKVGIFGLLQPLIG